MLAETLEPMPVAVKATVTLELQVVPTDGATPLSDAEVREMIEQAAESFTHVSRERINAFNEISRLRSNARGRIVAVETQSPTVHLTQLEEGSHSND